ncbi:TPA: DUF3267 domain-containing protein [Bacillus cereus]|uniref:DUF3267 domain-containing protein n=1 Tax=Bacillus cereus TaxID=1396 RepID=A0A1D3NDB2_BACCE|nr:MULTISPECIES: DUF3267 domain-containing protein [Bacillus]MCP1179508.1 DUF3267 domain-containing protein [Bacillus sp. 1663tsa1]MCP1284759.1 DUF3267 domain-containing protein [Bacillus sp. S0635]MCQ6349135.1 DUF3267 domain-containing protein [Bacillus cereus]MCU5462817.1 DUF3267 domain-containing protein [Bacillus cereus]MCU5751947.1 DUF3267 domain-containing protein [Bacillus cereus]
MDYSEWTPFIQNDWYQKHYMKFVYLFQIIIFMIPYFFETSFTHINIFYLIIIGILVFIIHECLHILVISKKGDISLTFSGIFFWLNTNATLSKIRFWVFMSLPVIALSVVPAMMSFFVSGNIKSILLFICWINTFISASDIYNSFLIAMKPKNSFFCRGYYQVK